MYWNSLCKCSKHYDYQKPSISSCLNSKLLYLLAALSKFWMVCVGLAQCNSNMTMKPWRRHKNPKLLIWTTSPPHSFKYSSGYFIQIFILYVHCKYNTQSWTLGKESFLNEGSDKFQNRLHDSWCQRVGRGKTSMQMSNTVIQGVTLCRQMAGSFSHRVLMCTFSD